MGVTKPGSFLGNIPRLCDKAAVCVRVCVCVCVCQPTARNTLWGNFFHIWPSFGGSCCCMLGNWLLSDGSAFLSLGV